MFCFTFDFQGQIYGTKLRWLAGIGIMNFKTGIVDIERLNKGKKEDKLLTDTITLYDHYVDWCIIPADEKNGGNANFINAGIVFDTRDNEPNPMKSCGTKHYLEVGKICAVSFVTVLWAPD